MDCPGWRKCTEADGVLSCWQWFSLLFLESEQFPYPLTVQWVCHCGFRHHCKTNLHSCEYSCTVTAPVGGRVTHAWIARMSTFALNVAILSEYWICVQTEYISSFLFFFLHSLACVTVAAFTLSKLIYHVPCSIGLICGANLDARAVKTFRSRTSLSIWGLGICEAFKLDFLLHVLSSACTL